MPKYLMELLTTTLTLSETQSVQTELQGSYRITLLKFKNLVLTSGSLYNAVRRKPVYYYALTV